MLIPLGLAVILLVVGGVFLYPRRKHVERGERSDLDFPAFLRRQHPTDGAGGAEIDSGTRIHPWGK